MSNNNNENKKHPMKSPADELICPISLELPHEPVMAQDGRVYDKTAIEAHFEKHQGELKSPITNEPMGRKLVEAVWVRNHIETLVEFGVIGGDLADKWNEKVKEKAEEKKEMEKLLKAAEGGDKDAMYRLGVHHTRGRAGFSRDRNIAFQWYKKAHQAGSVKGTAALGKCYLFGSGVARNNTLGMSYSSLAAGQGSDVAAYHLGFAFADGLFGMHEDKAEAIYWLEKAASAGSYVHLLAFAKTKAQKKLDELRKS